MALMHAEFFSNTLGLCVQAEIILPQQTVGQIGMEGKDGGKSIRTLYLLHGMSDDQTIWERRTSVERYASEAGIAVVMPTTQLGWYTNMECGYQRYYDYVAKELPVVCRSFFPQMSAARADNAIAGLSMGGYGALKIGLNESSFFGKAASLSGSFNITERPDAPYWNSIFGVPSAREKHTVLFAAQQCIAENRPRPELFLWCGTEDVSCLPGNEALQKQLLSLGYSVDYSTSPGTHCWKNWDEEIQRVIAWFCK